MLLNRPSSARRRHLSVRAGSMQKTICNRYASCRSRKLGTAFRSPATTLSHHYEVNAPALFLRFRAVDPSQTRSIEAPPLGSVSKPNRAKIITFDPLSAPTFDALEMAPIPTPLQAVSSLSDQSVRSASSQQARLARRSFVHHSPWRTLPISPRIVAQNSA